MPMIGAQRRNGPLALSTSPAMTSRVARVLRGAAIPGTPSGTFFNWSKTTGMTVTGVSMMTVPVTVGVRIRRNSASRAENANWNRARIRTRMASNAGPPSASAAMLTAMAAPEVPVTRT